MKKHLSTILLIAVFLIGLSLLLYPSVSDYWNSFHQSRAIAGYSRQVAQLEGESCDRLWQAAEAYNRALRSRQNVYRLTQEQQAEYESLLNLSGTGIMGSIEIPAIECTLPIYHGTGEAVLQNAVGHLEWSSLPVGGQSTHCVLSGHRGLPSAKLFTNLDRLALGDTFRLRILDEVLTYEVDQLLTVEPQETAALQIVPGQDYCTLVTCTPYGINTHRLLVRGHRVDTQPEAETIRVTADAIPIEPLTVAPVAAAPLMLLALMGLLLPGRRRR